MRKAGIILCVLILTGGFSAAWVVLSPESVKTGANELADSADGANELQPLDSPAVVTEEDAERDPDAPIESDPEQGADKPAERETDTTRPGGESKPRVDTQRTTPQTPRDPAKRVEGDAGDSTDTGEAAVPPSKPEPFIKGHERPPGQNLGNVRPRSRRLAQPAGMKKLDDVTPKLRQDRRGLYAQYFGLSDADLTKLDKSNPDMVRIDRQVYFPDRDAFSDLPISLDNFAAEWTGFLVIDEPGDYWLFWGADNGGRVELDGETVLLQDGMVRYVEVSTVLTLEAGLHPLKIEFAQTKNNVADWAKCAAALMYVPEGESKPVPVPPEMLMVPEWMWSDNAPIITKLSKTEGEIGDEITIYGQGLADPPKEGDVAEFRTVVSFSGQSAVIAHQSDDQLKVTVPIGADTGDVIVYRKKYTETKVDEDDEHEYYLRLAAIIPSNSLQFTVTTRFGLLAEWHNLQGWDNFPFVEPGTRQPELVRLEHEFMFANRNDLQLDFKDQPLACRWTGYIGVPHDKWREIWIQADSSLRVTIDGETYESFPTVRANGQPDTLAFLHLDADPFAGRKTPITIEIAAPGLASLQILAVRPSMATTVLPISAPIKSISSDAAPRNWFFPPKAPPVPPEIDFLGFYGEQPTGPGFAYDLDETGEPISVGGGFSLTWKSHADFDWDVDRADVLIDGIVVETEGEPVEADAPWVATREIGVIPEGAREGVAVVRITRGDGTVLESEPYYFNLATQGLATYLYDVPEGSGLNELPDLGPLHCFKVRKDKQINFESAADFDLPFPAETFVIEWLGGLVIEEEGDYEFICRSDDGMMLWLDDNVVIDANHRQAPAENKATVHLVPGTYRFRMQFFENNQHEVCVLEWRATRGEGEMLEELIPRQVVPARAFSLDVHPPFPAKTSTGKKTDGS